jgi:hypothetical protein
MPWNLRCISRLRWIAGMPHWPRAVGKHHHVGAEPRRRIHRILARRDGVDTPVEAVFRARSQLDPRLLVIGTVGLDPAGAQCIDDHRGRFVEPAAALVHRAAERSKFAPRQPPAKPEPQPAVGKKVEHRRLLGHA